ncbi:MAG: hypothetical protein HYX61_03800 [Gammaproteobacteria bacterium]|jgi:precorrin-6B methylase 2|nr:hypothetical protein [Gammaproteobacteria bacterium]
MTLPTIYFILLLVCFIALIPFVKKILRNFHRKRKYTAILKEINLLFQEIDAFKVAKDARIKYEKSLTDLYYGEIDICALLDLLDIASPPQQCVFYDLGSGCGKSAFAVKLNYPHLKVHGIELIEELHDIANQKLHQYLDKNGLAHHDFGLEFIQANILNHNFTHADIIFINATAFSPGTWQQILYKLMQMKCGTKIIITSKTLPSPAFVIRYQAMELMSWGFTSTYIYEKVI